MQGPIAGPALLSGYGVITQDGNGGLTGTQNSQTINGMMGRTFTGTYVVNQDGTGTLEMDFPPPPSDDPTVAPTLQPASHFAFVLVDGGKSLQTIQPDPGSFVSGNFIQQ